MDSCIPLSRQDSLSPWLPFLEVTTQEGPLLPKKALRDLQITLRDIGRLTITRSPSLGRRVLRVSSYTGEIPLRTLTKRILRHGSTLREDCDIQVAQDILRELYNLYKWTPYATGEGTFLGAVRRLCVPRDRILLQSEEGAPFVEFDLVEHIGTIAYRGEPFAYSYREPIGSLTSRALQRISRISLWLLNHIENFGSWNTTSSSV
ncbi:MAG: hypothetical protein JSR76_07425 [Verrucomicrobia bacterium]|nr:hypothetical protein [Verrucomicrobiota bacterium]